MSVAWLINEMQHATRRDLEEKRVFILDEVGTEHLYEPVVVGAATEPGEFGDTAPHLFVHRLIGQWKANRHGLMVPTGVTPFLT